MIMGVADSGLPHAHGYAKQKIEMAIKKSRESIQHFEQGDIDLGVLRASLMTNLKSIAPLRRPVIKYTAGWGRSYIPPQQSTRDLIAYYKQVSNPNMISHKSITLVDDSIRRGTQLRKFIKDKILLFKPKAIHARIASPPQLFPCYFDETTRANDLIARTAIKRIEKSDQEDISEYLDQNSVKYQRMVALINESLGASSLRYIALSDMIKAIVEAPGNNLLGEENLCTYCWTGKKPV
jgi:amidophosphoribosyltransferase